MCVDVHVGIEIILIEVIVVSTIVVIEVFLQAVSVTGGVCLKTSWLTFWV